MSDRERREAVVRAALGRLGRVVSVPILDVRLLAGGLSGAAVYRFRLDGEDVVLKVTPPGAGSLVRVRARREVLFYRDLAGRVPVAVPRVLGLDDSEGAALLLAAYVPSSPPGDWVEGDFVQVAWQLGRLHAAFVDEIGGPAMPAWPRTKSLVTPAQCRKAAGLWRGLGERDDLRDAVRPRLPRLERILERIPALEGRMPAMPVTLCHGDCHAENLLRGVGGEWIWADWQEVRLGPGVDDLAFFWTRAFAAAGSPPPYDAMVRAYAAGLETVGGARIERERLERTLARAEIRSWLVDWPAYLGALPAATVERVLRRIDALFDRLGVVAHG